MIQSLNRLASDKVPARKHTFSESETDRFGYHLKQQSLEAMEVCAQIGVLWPVVESGTGAHIICNMTARCEVLGLFV